MSERSYHGDSVFGVEYIGRYALICGNEDLFRLFLVDFVGEFYLVLFLFVSFFQS